MEREAIASGVLERCWCPRCQEDHLSEVPDWQSQILLNDGRLVYLHLACAISRVFRDGQKESRIHSPGSATRGG